MLAQRPVPLASVAPITGRWRPDVTALHPALAARYAGLVAGVAPIVEAGLSPAVAANRVARSRVSPPALRLASWREERASFEHRLRRLSTGSPCLVLADVRDCYGSITPEAVERSLRRLGCAANAAARVGGFLERLRGILGIHGLPVGPDPSAVLANAVLAGADAALARAGVRHLRWVDDVVAAAWGRRDAESILRILRAALARTGLELNEAKTRVVLDPARVHGGVAVSATGGGPPVR